jgi:hypothetical protein
MRTSNPSSSAIHVVKQQTQELNQRADRIANQKSPTVPQYDLPDNPPAVAIEGQLATDLNGKLWWFIDAEWRTC